MIFEAALIYDYATTLPLEVQLFWRRSPTGASVLYFSNRYLTLFVSIFDLATMAPMGNPVRVSISASHLSMTVQLS